jgi:hypothetical protein
MLNILIRTKIKVYLYKSYSVGTIYYEDVFKLFRLARSQINFLKHKMTVTRGESHFSKSNINKKKLKKYVQRIINNDYHGIN